ncbi:MAG: hypothetical protein O6952_02840, partial [Planctomycetota bacterium]|nr:hypothetical protein [Planctomycetota bacterium]
MKSCKFVLFGWLMVAVAGCAAHDHMAFGTQLDHKEALTKTAFDEPLPGPLSNLLLAETALGESRTEPLKEGAKDYPFPRGAFDQVVAAMLRDSGGFETVGLAKDLQSGDSESREGLILQIELEEQGVLFQSRTSGSGWALAGWILGITA